LVFNNWFMVAFTFANTINSMGFANSCQINYENN
jgi:hypothetical protein